MSEISKVLSVKNLTISISGKKIVNSISFDIYKNEIVSIVGESASGKSITSLSLMGLLPKKSISSGEINFNGVDILKLSENQYNGLRGKKIAMIFQEPMTALNPSLRCGNQVAEVLKIHTKNKQKEIKKEVLSLFEKVKLPDVNRIYKSYPHELSGGQKQRVMIAMAIACKPQILIADEPTTALDASVQKDVITLIREVQRQMNMSVLFISHDISLVSQIADRVLVMLKGEIVEQGKITDVFTQPKHSYTKALLASKPNKEIRYKRLMSVDDFMKNKTEYQVITSEQRSEFHKKIYAQSPLLKVENLIKVYNKNIGFLKKIEKVKAIDKVSFEIYKGETLGLVGESGCGKTTLGRILVKLEKANSGQVFFKDVDILKKKREYSCQVQMIFQDPYSSLNPSISIGEAILEPMKMHNLYENHQKRKQKVIKLLHQVGLSESDYHKYPHQFSGGQRQRIGIARAIALNPELIICDESVSALDVSIQAQVLNLLNELKEKYGFTYLFISHDLNIVKYMSDRVMVLKEGKVVEIQEADKLYTNPKSDYTKQLISEGY